MKKIRVLIVEPNKEPYQAKIEHTLKNLQNVVDGYIEILELEHNVDLICNEEGKINNLLLNRVVDYDIIAGTFIIAGYKDSETISLSRKQIKKYKEYFRLSKHKKYLMYILIHSRNPLFQKSVNKYGLLKAVQRKVKI